MIAYIFVAKIMKYLKMHSICIIYYFDLPPLNPPLKFGTLIPVKKIYFTHFCKQLHFWYQYQGYSKKCLSKYLICYHTFLHLSLIWAVCLMTNLLLVIIEQVFHIHFHFQEIDCFYLFTKMLLTVMHKYWRLFLALNSMFDRCFCVFFQGDMNYSNLNIVKFPGKGTNFLLEDTSLWLLPPKLF